MKKLVLALSMICFAMTVSAHPRTNLRNQDHWCGRHDNIKPPCSVPETTPTLAMMLIGVASLGVAAASRNSKKLQA